MRILLTGPTGQVGCALRHALESSGTVVAADRRMADLADPPSAAALVEQLRPDVVINAAAYTDVEGAETNEATANLVNAVAPGMMAAAARDCSALFVHYSTDYVFDGEKAEPYRETDTPGPLNAYGRTKLAGEQAIAAAGGDWIVLRTSWVYSETGRNFAKTILRLARERDTLSVVADQYGAPTTARLIASVTAAVLGQLLNAKCRSTATGRIYHLASAGRTSWHGFASALVAAARTKSGPDQLAVRAVEPVSTAQYPTRAARPGNSCLDTERLRATFGVSLPAWDVELATVAGRLIRAPE